jgi:hypothetical protein
VPQDHWANAKATGVAYDLALPEGTPVYAPADGLATFAKDTRPYETNLGHYVELATPDGWVIRLAHLRDAQTGQREVQTGDLLGHSGASGVSRAHLHLELLVSGGARLAAPDAAQIDSLFGLPIADYVEGAIIVNATCPPALTLVAPPRYARDVIPLGEAAQAVVSVRNDSLASCALQTVQLLLTGPDGSSLLAEAQGNWELASKATVEVTVPVRPNAAGVWTVRSVICLTTRGSCRLSTTRGLVVRPSPLQMEALTVPDALDAGARISLSVQIANAGGADRWVDDLVVEGVQPDGSPWLASAGHRLLIAARSTVVVELGSPTVPQSVGAWRTARLGYVEQSRTLYLASPTEAFDVQGPELRLDRVAVYRYERRLNVFVRLTNVGTRTATPDALELWGWLGGGDTALSLTSRTMAPLAPQASALMQLSTTLEQAAAVQFVEGGYWIAGQYYRMALPN